ncbi:phage portal protein, partial [Cereibacter sphaeroides]|uniref:phage portal protein n=1 Tax=Cereibacter sphaeroides TaxID=1063 RepID=UPI0039A269B2
MVDHKRVAPLGRAINLHGAGRQLRGVSRFAPAIVKLFLLDQYDDAELDRKKVAAMYAMFITSNDPDAAPLEGELGDQVAPGQIV